MRETGVTYSPLYENLDTSYVNLAELLRYLQRQSFAGRVRVELEEYEADVWLRPGEKPHAEEKDRSTGRAAEGEDALQRLLVRATAPGGSISVYTEAEEEESEAAEGERAQAKVSSSPSFGAKMYDEAQASEDEAEEEERRDLLRTSGDLIAAVDVRPLIAIDLDGDKAFVHDVRDISIVVGLAIHNVAPVAPDRSDIEQDGLVLALSDRKRLFSPFMPLDGLMHGRAQVRRRSAGKGVEGLGGHAFSLKV